MPTNAPALDRDLRGDNGHFREKEQDGANDEQGEQRQMRERIRGQCLAKVRAAMGSTDAITERDYSAYEQIVLNERELEMHGMTEHEDKMRALEENRDRFIPEVIAEARHLENKFYGEIERAADKGVISKESKQRWIERLRSSDVVWYRKKSFLTKEFPSYLARWEKLHEEKERVIAHAAQLKITAAALPELGVLLHERFHNAHYDFRRDAVHRAIAALRAHEGKQEMLYARAKGRLEDAAAEGALSKTKVGIWLRRIFKPGATSKEVADFIAPGGRLQALIENWRKVRSDFNDIEGERQKKGPPRVAFFVSLKVFLEWDYDKRVSYIEQARNSFRDISKENPMLLDIRSEMAAKDWESARYLIDKAKLSVLTGVERLELLSMERFLLQHADDTKDGKKEKLSPNAEATAALRDMRRALAQLPGSLQPLYLKAMERGYPVLACLSSLMYNRVWSWTHNHLDAHKEQRLRETTTQETQRIVHEGHGKGHENNDGSFGKVAVRTYQEGEWSSQVLHVNAGSHGTLLETMQTQSGNHDFKYWTTLLPEGVDFATHRSIVESIQPVLKNGMRKLEACGMRFSLVGAPVSLN